MFGGFRIKLAAWCLRQLTRCVRQRAPTRSYSQRHFSTLPRDPFDVPVALAIRAATAFSSVVEIGAASGDRIRAIKSGLPAIEATAMDIGPDYSVRRVVNGIEFRPYAPADFPAGALVLSVGTLVFLSPPELDALLSAAAHRQCSLMIFEPAPPFDITRAITRPSGGWYHPYEQIAAAHGFRDAASNSRWRHTSSLKNFENWRCAMLAPG